MSPFYTCSSLHTTLIFVVAFVMLCCVFWSPLAVSPSRTNAEKLRASLNIAHALKVKISKEMHMLNHQLELVESFEQQVQGTEGVNQEDCSEFVSSLVTVMFEEEHMCKEFRTLIHGQQEQM